MVDMGRIRKFVRAALFVVAVGIVVMRFASCGGDGGLCRAGCLCARTPEACGSGCFPTYQRTDGGTTFFCANGPGLNDSGAGAVDGTTDADRDGPADGGGAGDRSDANLGDLSSSNCNMVSDPCNYYRPYCQPDGTCKNCNELGPQYCATASATLQACNGFGYCAECATNADCTRDPTKPICTRDTFGICVACSTNVDCEDPMKPTCHLSTGACGSCLSDLDCMPAPTKRSCNLGTGTCGP